jgi:predicted phosphodiesterase
MTLLLSLALSGCARPECSRPAYDRAECRVQAESALARLVTSAGVDLRFQEPDAEELDGWSAKGLIRQTEGGDLLARVNTLGRFALSLEGEPGEIVELTVDNVHPDAPPLEGEVSASGLRRELSITLGSEPVLIEGGLPEAACDGDYRLVAAGDIQTNPLQFKRIVEDLQLEAEAGEAEGEPLLGLVLLGDISEHSLAAEFDQVLEILQQSPVPAVVIPGNHDVYDSQDAVFNRSFGPGNVAFDVCETRMVLLDSGSGHLADSVHGRLPELIGEGGGQLLAGFHHPLYPGQRGAGWTSEDQSELVLAELAANQVDLVLSGHLHMRLEPAWSPVPEVIVGTAGANQGAGSPDYGVLRVVLDGSGQEAPSWCFVPSLAPGLDASPRPDAEPVICSELR